ncbi:MAG: four helix bundle protein [Patescibacteria group bacterium]
MYNRGERNVFDANLSVNALFERIKLFGVTIVNTFSVVNNLAATYRIVSQVVSSATSIGANFSEAQAARSKKEFIAILGIALKEAKETSYWLDIVNSLDMFREKEKIKFNELLDESMQLEKILASIIISAKRRN